MLRGEKVDTPCQPQYLTTKPKKCSRQYVGIEEPSNLTASTQYEEEWANEKAEIQKDKSYRSAEKCLGGPCAGVFTLYKGESYSLQLSLFCCNAGHCSHGEWA